MSKNKTVEFRKELQTVLNKYNKENESDTPDFILAQYLEDCLYTFDIAIKARENWYKNNVNVKHVHKKSQN